jgi:NDP-sugar pyrophosphorylase family protein
MTGVGKAYVTGFTDDCSRFRVKSGACRRKSAKESVDAPKRAVRKGRVQVAKGTKIVNSTIRGPVSIAEGCLIENSTIGPHTSIGGSSIVKDSSVEYCILLEGSKTA